ncbi:MAG: cytochrome C [Myxococcales bacterium]|nr:cytochrome C [Myxococcales bacterium]
MRAQRIARIAACLSLTLSGDAWGFDFEKLVMPGPVSEVHAEIEGDCASCHAPFDRENQRDRCLRCHEEVAEDLQAGSGLHGRDARVKGSLCRDCHSEHQGRDADILGFNRESFQHRFTDFELRGRHREVECASCHVPEKAYREATQQCADCHGEDDAHGGQLGDDCSSCHVERGWKDTKFEHASTGFALEGAHARVDCRVCHAGPRYQGTPTDCRACHATNDRHGGHFGRDCSRCHVPKSWKDSAFDHAAETRFALTHRHADAKCSACHSGPLAEQNLETRCGSCHASDDIHRGRNGTDCESCHSERGWDRATFDHDTKTAFPLRGSHAEVACQHCHQRNPREEDLSGACGDCHARDDAHADTLGRDCGRCHNESGWRKHVNFDHDITRFPLLGLHAVELCEACHTSTRFRDADPSCVACHSSDDRHEQKLGSDCGRCHNPNGWSIWRFDHGRETNFPLRGNHEGLNCLACHTRASPGAVTQTSSCATCHDFDDIHSGGFGRDCSRCHSEEGWRNLKINPR